MGSIVISCPKFFMCLYYAIIIYIRSTGNERRQLLQSILRADDENDEDEDEAPDDEVKISKDKYN